MCPARDEIGGDVPAETSRRFAALPAEAVGLRLCRINSREELILCEKMRFPGGQAAIDTVLRRAAISGQVEVGGDIKDHWADILNKDGCWFETVALDRKSYSALKNRWMRCRVERSP